MTVSAFTAKYAANAYTVARVTLIAVVLGLLTAAPANAHPLGNFSVNHLSTVSISADRVEIRYVLDQAEIPTVQERGLSRAEVLRRKLAEIRRGLSLTVDGRKVALRPAGQPTLTFPAGAGGLDTTRLEVSLDAAVRRPAHVALTDNTFSGRVGWKAITAVPGEGTAVRTSAPTGDPTDGLRRYPTGLLDSPLDRREADFSVTPGTGTLLAPREEGGKPTETQSAAAGGAANSAGEAGAARGASGGGAPEASGGGAPEASGARAREASGGGSPEARGGDAPEASGGGAPEADGAGAASEASGAGRASEGSGAAERDAVSGGARSDGFAGLFEDAAAGRGVLVALLLAAFGWGAVHALSPGHGKAMVAAYLIGTRGTARDAVVLGATVTVTHTIGVFALGLVTLGLSQYVLPEQLYPWLTLISGLMVVLVGASVLRSRLRRRSGHGPDGAQGHRHAHGHQRAHGHRGAHGHGQPRVQEVEHGGRDAQGHEVAHEHRHAHSHAHGHRHAHGDQHRAPSERAVGTAGLLSMGAAAGLLPCPSALVVLLAAISQHEVALGMLLIVAFSLGLAGTLTVLGLAVVHARRFIPPRIAASRLAVVLPALSAVLVVAIGLVLAARAVPDVM